MFFFNILISCEKDEISTFQGLDGVRFPAYNENDHNSDVLLSDTEPKGYNSDSDLFFASKSFMDDPLAEEAVYDVPVMLIGKPTDYDRKIPFEIDTEKSNVSSDYYEIIEAVIPANQYQGYIRFKLKNSEEFEEYITYTLYLKLISSDEFSTKTTKYLKASLSWNKLPVPPQNARLIRTYNMMIAGASNFISTSLNYYSPRALQTIVEATGWNDWDDYDIHGVQYNSEAFQSYKFLPRYDFIYTDKSYMGYAEQVGKYIEKYNNEHPDKPLIHDAGLLVGQKIEARKY